MCVFVRQGESEEDINFTALNFQKAVDDRWYTRLLFTAEQRWLCHLESHCEERSDEAISKKGLLRGVYPERDSSVAPLPQNDRVKGSQ